MVLPWFLCLFGVFQLQQVQNGLLRLDAHQLLQQLAVPEEQQGGNAEHLIVAHQLKFLVDVDLADLHQIGMFHDDLVENGGLGHAGAAPVRPEIHQHRQFGVQHFLFKIGFRYGNGHIKDSFPSFQGLVVEQIKKKGFDILYLTNYLDEFVISVLREEDGKTFKSVSDSSLDLDTEEEKEANKKLNEDNKDMLAEIKDALGDEVTSVRFTNKLDSHPVCLTSEGEISVEMQKVINAMPTDENVKAKLVLEINEKHDIVKKLEKLYKEDKAELKKYAKVLYSEARLIEGLSIDNPTEISNLICELIAK